MWPPEAAAWRGRGRSPCPHPRPPPAGGVPGSRPPEAPRSGASAASSLDAGVPVAFGSDFPVEVVDPLWGLYAAMTRRDNQGHPEGGWHPEQLLTLHEALHAFTAGAAFASFDEDRLGRLRPGMRADVTLFDRDLFQTTPDELRRAEVTETIIDGEVVYSASRAGSMLPMG